MAADDKRFRHLPYGAQRLEHDQGVDKTRAVVPERPGEAADDGKAEAFPRADRAVADLCAEGGRVGLDEAGTGNAPVIHGHDGGLRASIHNFRASASLMSGAKLQVSPVRLRPDRLAGR